MNRTQRLALSTAGALAGLVIALPMAAAAPAAVPAGQPASFAAPSAPSAPANAPCGTNGRNLDTTVVTATTAVQIRNGSSTGCAAVGAAQRGDRLDYYCYTNGPSYSWTFLKDLRTGTVGWVRDDSLPNYGSSRACGL